MVQIPPPRSSESLAPTGGQTWKLDCERKRDAASASPGSSLPEASLAPGWQVKVDTATAETSDDENGTVLIMHQIFAGSDLGETDLARLYAAPAGPWVARQHGLELLWLRRAANRTLTRVYRLPSRFVLTTRLNVSTRGPQSLRAAARKVPDRGRPPVRRVGKSLVGPARGRTLPSPRRVFSAFQRSPGRLVGVGGSGRFAIQRSRRKARSLSSRLPNKAVPKTVSATVSSTAAIPIPIKGCHAYGEPVTA